MRQLNAVRDCADERTGRVRYPVAELAEEPGLRHARVTGPKENRLTITLRRLENRLRG